VQITPNDLRASILAKYVQLDQMERDKFASSSFEQLITQTQEHQVTVTGGMARIPLTFNHACTHLMFVVQRDCHKRTNNWTNFSGVDGRDPIQTAELLLNTASRFGKQDALYYRAVVPHEYASQTPESYLYCMAFGLDVNNTNPNGSCNLSRIDNAVVNLTMQSALANESYTVTVWAQNYNIMRFKEGVAGAAFQ
jgi:hypothetical protein